MWRALNLNPSELPANVHGFGIFDQSCLALHCLYYVNCLSNTLTQWFGLLAHHCIERAPKVVDHGFALHLLNSHAVALTLDCFRKCFETCTAQSRRHRAKKRIDDV